MKKAWISITSAAAWLACAVGGARADGPAPSSQALDVQGVLRTQVGDLQTSAVGLVVSLYAAQADKAPFFSQSFTTVPVDNGFFAVELSGMSLSFDTLDAWVGIQVAGDAVEMPRQHLTSVPYSFVARNAVGDITPHSVSINGTTVLDAAGNATIPGNLKVGGSMFGDGAQTGNVHPDPAPATWSFSHAGPGAGGKESWVTAWSLPVKLTRPSLLWLALDGHWTTAGGNCAASIVVDGKPLGDPNCSSDIGYCWGTTLITANSGNWVPLGFSGFTMADAGEHKIGLAVVVGNGASCSVNGSSVYWAAIPR